MLHYVGIWGGKEPETFRVLSDPGCSLAIQLFRGFSTISPHQFPHTVPLLVRSYLQIPWQARIPGLRQPEAPAKQIPVPHRLLCPQLCTPVHPLALPTLPLCSLGHVPIHTATAAPTSIAITTPLPLPPQPLAPVHHPPTHPACRAITMCCQGSHGRGDASQHHAEGFGG